MRGWQCPGCGACYGPFVDRCGNCQPRVTLATTTTPYVPPPVYVPGARPDLIAPPRRDCAGDGMLWRPEGVVGFVGGLLIGVLATLGYGGVL